MKKSLLSLAILATLSGCSLIPDYQRPAAPVAAAYPQGEAYAEAGDSVALPGWKTFFHDPALRQLVSVALENNRDLRVTALNLEAYRAQYRISRAALFPNVDVAAGGSRQRLPGDLSQTGEPYISSQYSATLGASWEPDFFGRLGSLREEALQQYLASAEAQRSAHISLVANVANAYLTWLADQTLLQITRDTLETYQNSLKLTQRSFDVGVASALELQQARTAADNARVALAQYTRAVAQDRNGLTLLLGAPIPLDLPAGASLDAKLLDEVPAGLPSELLERRPDILEAEHQLLAANADIGAARAAFFPSVSLTANAGTMSSEMSGLFDGGSGTWLFQPQISLPIFNAGSLRASLEYSEVIRDTRVAQYERAIQGAFRDVADGLAARQTYREQMDAQAAQLESTQGYFDLAERRYRAGVDSYLTLLDAQRQLFSVRQQAVTDRLAQLTSEVNLYMALGGGWVEQAPEAGSAPQAAPQG